MFELYSMANIAALEDSISDESEEESVEEMDQKTKEQLKNFASKWIDYDDKIKELNGKVAKIKKLKKQNEVSLLKIINQYESDENKIKINIKDPNDELRGRVYRYKSTTKEPLKQDVIKRGLLEALGDQTKVDEMYKKIESKRRDIHRNYIKRTNGNRK
jgi:ABC-type Fe2+-enterobactin transport system substrate-binding protein